MKTAFPLTRLAALLAVLTLSACATNPALKESNDLLAQGRAEDGVQRLEQGMRDAPQDHELRAQYFRQREQLIGQLLAAADGERAANRHDAAQALYLRVQKLDPNNARVRYGLAEMVLQRRHDTLAAQAQALHAKGDNVGAERLVRTVLTESPNHGDARRLLQTIREHAARAETPAQSLQSVSSKLITLEFRDTTLKTVFEVISRTAGINFVFDRDVKADNKVNIFVRNTSIEEVVKILLLTNQLERKLLNDNSALIYPNTPAKAKDYQELVTRSFFLANADVKQAQALIKTLVKTKDVFADEKLNLLIIKDTPEAVRLAERLLESLDTAEPEVMLDVEVLEMTRSKLLELGLRFPDQVGYGALQPTLNSTVVNGALTTTSTTLGGTLAPGFVDLNNTGNLTSFVSNPALMLNLKNQVGDGSMLANPRIRVKNREKAQIHIGDKLPVFTTTSTANVGVAASVSYLDVGLKLNVEPNVYLDDDVGIKVGLEVSSIVKEVAGPANSLAYQVGTRSASTVLRLKNGETQILAGLISDEERSSANRLPGLGDIPVLGRLFSSQRDNSSKTEIVLLITPRVVRNLPRPDALSATGSAGSESSVGAPLLQLKKNEPRTLSLSSSPAGAASTIPGVPSAAVNAQPREATSGEQVAAPVPSPAPAPAPAPEAASPEAESAAPATPPKTDAAGP